MTFTYAINGALTIEASWNERAALHELAAIDGTYAATAEVEALGALVGVAAPDGGTLECIPAQEVGCADRGARHRYRGAGRGQDNQGDCGLVLQGLRAAELC
jgi:hypothetical protein